MSLRNLCLFLTLILPTVISSADDPAASPSEVARDPDYGIQGEYVGPKRAMQVVALGEGEFQIVVFEGGLPGAGARGEPRRVDGDEQTVAELVKSNGMKRIERKSPTLGSPPPAGALVLFDGSQESIDQYWDKGTLSDSGLLIPEAQTKQQFQDYTLHVEFRTPWMPKARGQGRGNSGVYHQGRYETQVLDSFGLTGEMNETGGIYSIKDPDLNMCLPPMQWQTYDVEFTAARYDADGKRVADARVTVRLNGVIVQQDVALPKSTTAAPQKEGADGGPIYLQDHGNPVRYRNIWILPRDRDREARRPIIPGFERFFASTDNPAGGDLLLADLGCVHCHNTAQDFALPIKRGPNLDNAKGRLRPDALLAMIASPHKTKAGTTMPDPWPGLSDEERQERARAIASYLLINGTGELHDRTTTSRPAKRGDRLYHSVGCVACHAPQHGDQTPLETTVPLGDLARKYTLSSLAEFLLAPHAVRPGTRMPALIGSRADAFAIAAYLTGDVTVRSVRATYTRRVYRGSWDKLPDFDALEPVQTDKVTGLKIDDIQPVENFGAVFNANIRIENDGEYLFKLRSDDGSALRINDASLLNDGIHGGLTREAKFLLKAGVYPIQIEIFNKGGGVELSVDVADPDFGIQGIDAFVSDENILAPASLVSTAFRHDASLTADGRRWFTSAGCVNCHSFCKEQRRSPAGTPVPSLTELRLDAGCLATNVQSPAVDYQLSTAQVESLRAAIARRQTGDPNLSNHDLVHQAMAGLNCYACHMRNQIGGPEPNRDQRFSTSIPEMGSEGRLPPPLDGVGDKLSDKYLKLVLSQGAMDRPYMQTRMPAYRDLNLTGLKDALVKIDRRSSTVEPTVHNALSPERVAAGRKVVGNRGLACIKCHAYGGSKGGGIGAIDMLKMPERLRESWFHRYLQNPQAFRPGTRMPNSFPEGKSPLESLFGGDPTQQIDAIWGYLLKGKDAKEPDGLKAGSIVLAAGNRPLIYRNFFAGLSARGIGVAFPEDVNLMWDAEQMTLSRLWKNSFIDASMHWVGRGQGSQQPLGDHVVGFESKTPFALLDSLDGTWPNQSGRDRGYRFLGYRLDHDGRPTFRYSIDEITVEDKLIPLEGELPSPGFERQITILRGDQSAAQHLVWLAGEGTIEQQGGQYKIGPTTVEIKGVDCARTSFEDRAELRALVPNQPITHIRQTIRW